MKFQLRFCFLDVLGFESSVAVEFFLVASSGNVYWLLGLGGVYPRMWVGVPN